MLCGLRAKVLESGQPERINTVRSKLKNGELKNRKLKTRHCPPAGASLAPEPPTRSGEDRSSFVYLRHSATALAFPA